MRNHIKSLFDEDLALPRLFENLDDVLVLVSPSALTVIEVVGMLCILIQVLPRFMDISTFLGTTPISYIEDGGELARQRLAWCLQHIRRDHLQMPDVMAMIGLLRPVAARTESTPLAQVIHLRTTWAAATADDAALKFGE